MSPPPARRAAPMPAALRTRLQADLTQQRAAGNLWLLIAVCLAVGTTAYFGWLGLYRAHAAPTYVPMIVAAVVGLAGIVAAAIVRQRRPAWLHAALATAQVDVVEGKLHSADILPQQAALARAPRCYVLAGYAHPVLEESPAADDLSGFVPQRVIGPAAGTPLRLLWNAEHPGHLLQVDYPGLAAVIEPPAPMQSQDWKDLTGRPRAALRAVAWLAGALLLGLAVVAAVPSLSRGFSVWLCAGLAVALLWLLCVCLPLARMWLQRGHVRCETVTGPVQELMWARRNDGRQGVEHALFARVGGQWHLLDTAGKASALHTALVPGATLSVRYAVLGDHRVRLGHAGAASVTV